MRKRVVTASSDEKLCKEMKTKMYAITRNANKRLKRREALISEQKECIENQKAIIKNYKRKMKAAESKIEELRAKISRVSHRATYWRGERLRVVVARNLLKWVSYVRKLKS